MQLKYTTPKYKIGTYLEIGDVILGSKVLVSLRCSRSKYLRAFYLLSIFKA